MPRTTEGNLAIREQQRMQILRAALYVFARRGWSATMADIAQRAGISQGLAYRYFEGKEEIFASLIERAQELRVVERMLADPSSPREGLRKLLATLLVPGSVELEFYQFSMQVARDETAPPSLRPILEELAGRFREGLRQAISAGQIAGEFRPGNSESLAIALFAMINGLTLLSVRGNPQVLEHFPNPDLVMHLLDP